MAIATGVIVLDKLERIVQRHCNCCAIVVGDVAAAPAKLVLVSWLVDFSGCCCPASSCNGIERGHLLALLSAH